MRLGMLPSSLLLGNLAIKNDTVWGFSRMLTLKDVNLILIDETSSEYPESMLALWPV